MILRSVTHKGLKRFLEKGDASGLPPQSVSKIRNMLSFMQAMEDVEELRRIPGWRLHKLQGEAAGVWSLTVTRNWRLTFRVDTAEGAIIDLNYMDYH